VGRSMDRRSFLTRSAAAAAGLAMVGEAGEVLGAGPALAAANNGPGRDGISTAKPKRGGHLVFGVDAEESGFNPTTARFDEVGVMYARTVFDPYTIITKSGGWAPYLAQSVTSNPDYTSWTVTVRPNVMFHDGTPCDGAAMLMNFEAQLNAYLTGLVLKPIVDNFQQTGQYSVVVNLKSPFIPFPYYLAGGIGGQVAYPMAPAMINAPNGGTDSPIGTGPFKFKQWIPNDFFTATANPNYWRSGMPYLDQITFKPVVDPTARSEALQAGTIDIMVTDTPQVNVLYKGKSQWSYIDDSGNPVGEPDMNCLQLNLQKAPFNDRTVRLAAAKALSSGSYSRIIDLGFNPPTNGLFVPGSPYYSNVSYPSYDVSAATSLVKQAERKNGGPISFSLGSTNSPEAVRAAEYMQSKFQAVGFKVTLATIEQNELINNALAGDFQAYEWRQFGAVNPDLNYIFWSTTTYANSGISINMARNYDPRVEAALQIGRTSTSSSARAAAYKKVNQLFAQDLPYLWNDRAVWAVVAKPSVENFNNPTSPSGQKAYGMITGSVWPTQIWLS
jgi:peptide/nickel transport system substrate-binding protein